MKFSSILILSTALVISKAADCVPECWSEKLGFPCCKEENPEVYYKDENGEWGAENDNWCGILVYDPNADCGSTTEKPKTQKCECWSEELGFPCCAEANPEVYYTDENGKWGAENDNWCGIIDKENCAAEEPEEKPTPQKEDVPKCQFYNCGTVTSIGEDGSFYSTNDHGKCYIDLNDKSCKQAFEYYNKALALGYKLCKEQHEDDLVRDEDGLWAMEDGEWCGIEICPRCEIGNIDKYGLIWSVDGNNGNSCVVDKDNECKYTLQTYCRTAKAGYKCCEKTKEVVALDEVGYWGIEDGKWCGINNPFSCEYYEEKGIKCCDQIRVNFNNLNMTAEGIFTTADKEICGVSLED